jgi:hypothetical protein
MRLAVVFSLLVCLTACSQGAPEENARCAREAPPDARYPWGYYAGYGCGPITPRVTAPFG